MSLIKTNNRHRIFKTRACKRENIFLLGESIKFMPHKLLYSVKQSRQLKLSKAASKRVLIFQMYYSIRKFINSASACEESFRYKRNLCWLV